jgi:FKBP-type peptidyl-prolyl cis-trans isomerase
MKKKVLIGLVVAMIVIAGIVLSRSIANAPKNVDKSDVSVPSQIQVNQTNENKPMQLEIKTTQEGTGDRVVKAGDTVSVQYTGKLEDGTKFDSSYDHGGQPFSFTVGAGQVIKGWDEGLLGAKVGEKRTLTIPSDLGYGANGAGAAIPPNATLIFDIEIVSIK